MPRGTKLYSYVEVDDNTPLQKLGLSDQFRLLLRKMTEDPANDLRSEDSVTQEYLRLKADLMDFIKKSSEPLRQGTHQTVVVQISTTFQPVLREVISSRDVSNYYDIKIAKPTVEYDLPMDILLHISLKER